MQISLYDKLGTPVAYIDTLDDNTIYLWNGNPVCYLQDGNKIYGFNGQHIGWFEADIIRDLHGHKVGFTRATCPMLTQILPIKSLKRLKPIKSIKQIAHLKPIFKLTLSEEYLQPFLSRGAK